MSEDVTITVTRSTNKTFRLTVRNPNIENNPPVNLTGATVYFTVKDEAASTTALIEKTSADVAEINITDPTDGICEIYLVPADTEDLEPQTYMYDIWVKLSGGTQHPVIKKSDFKLEWNITVIP